MICYWLLLGCFFFWKINLGQHLKEQPEILFVNITTRFYDNMALTVFRQFARVTEKQWHGPRHYYTEHVQPRVIRVQSQIMHCHEAQIFARSRSRFRSQYDILSQCFSFIQSRTRIFGSLITGIGIAGVGSMGSNVVILSNFLAAVGIDLSPSLCSSITSPGWYSKTGTRLNSKANKARAFFLFIWISLSWIEE